MTIADRLADIDQLCGELFKANRQFIPLYPWCFVLVCTKEQQIGHIIMPEKQNKTVHEGIVLATWNAKAVEKTIVKDGVKQLHIAALQSEFVPGDRVAFHHFAGKPVPGWNSDRFRVVKERDWIAHDEGGIFGRIEYAEEKTKPIAELIEIFDESLYAGSEPVLEEKIQRRFVVVDREARSVTLSGI